MRRELRILSAACALQIFVGCHSEATFTSPPKKSFDQVSSEVFNFTSSEIASGSVTISDGGRYSAFNVAQTEKAPLQVIQKQLKRTAFNDSHAQGHSARYSKEEFQLSEAGMLDFLLVIDDSASMDDEQAMVGTGLTSLISEFKDTNWQIAVISESDPCVTSANLIKKTDVNVDKKFSNAVKKPLDRRATEQGFPMAIQALKGQCNGALRPWIREGSSVGILVVSDEDNCGSDPGEQDRCKNIFGKSANEMVSFLRGLRSSTDAKIYGILDHDGTCKDAGGKGSIYVDAVNQTGGSYGSICHDYTAAGGYSEFLKNVSKDVSRIIKRQFTLSSTPDMSQFNIAVDGQDFGTAGIMAIKGNVVTIDPARFQNGMKITFSYTHDATPMFSEVPVQTTPAMESLKVAVAGRSMVYGSDFIYDDARKVIKFTTMPPEDAKVTVSYLENKKLITHFPVNLSGVRADTIKVLVNGVLQDSSVYSFDSDGIDFSSPPSDGSFITVSWKTDAQKNLSYAASISDARHPVAWAVKDKSTGVDVPARWDGRTLSFNPDDVIDGRTITVTVDFGEKAALRVVDLPNERIDDDLEILADDKPGVCGAKITANSGGGVDTGEVDQNNGKGDSRGYETENNRDKPGPSVQNQEDHASKLEDKEADNNSDNKSGDWKKRYKGKQVSLQCKEGVDYKTLTIRYKHEVSRITEFHVPLPQNLDARDPNISWAVFIDGHQVKEFTRVGTDIHIDNDLLPPATRVDVAVKVYEPSSN